MWAPTNTLDFLKNFQAVTLKQRPTEICILTNVVFRSKLLAIRTKTDALTFACNVIIVLIVAI